ncbi:MAG: PH domain-containing protein [Tissierellia bacterium]|nr:PH domain-containing protein [Tissierellia bacterium]
MDIIWKDRKRILGMPISFTKYSLTEDRFFTTKGLFSSVEDQLNLYMVKDITLRRSFFQKMFGLGTIELVTSDPSEPNVLIQNIPRSKEIKEKINELINKQKRERNVLYYENFGDK